MEKGMNKDTKKYILPVSARSEKLLEIRKKQLVQYLNEHPQSILENLAYTLWKGDDHMDHRAVCVVSPDEDLKASDIGFRQNLVDSSLNKKTFMFPGQGAQYYRMGYALYNENEEFRKLLDSGFEAYSKITGGDLKSILFDSAEKDIAESKLAETALTQPALYIIEYAMAKLLIVNGIQPDYMIGHSIGEYTAACLAGVFDFDTGLKIVVKRGQLMQSMPTGEMFAVFSSKESLEAISNGIFEVAAFNTPESVTISFKTEDKNRIIKLLEDSSIRFIPLNTSHGFHSQAFDPILETFGDYVNQFDLKAPDIPFISCQTGKFITQEQAMNGSYWASQLRNSVLFYPGLKTILSTSQSLFFEVGPNTHLSGMFKRIPEIENKMSFILTLDKPGLSQKHTLEYVLGNIWAVSNDFIPDISFIGESGVLDFPEYSEEHELDLEANEASKSNDSNAGQDLKVSEDSVEGILLKIWKAELEKNEIGIDDNFFYVGGSSVMAIAIVDNAKKELNIDLELKNFFDAPTIKEFSKYIYTKYPELNKHKSEEGESTNAVESLVQELKNNKIKVSFQKGEFTYEGSDEFLTPEMLTRLEENKYALLKHFWPDDCKNLMPVHTEGEKTPLIIIHGGPANYPISDYVGKDRPFYGYFYIGSEGEKIRFKTLESFAAEYMRQLLQVLPEGPYYLGGFSLGGLLAYEIATQLEKMGKKVPLLFFMDSRFHPREKIKDLSLPKKIRKIISIVYRKFYDIFWRAKIEVLSFLNIKLPMEKRNKYITWYYVELIKKYKPKIKFEGKALLLRASDNKSNAKYREWEELCPDIDIKIFEGDHGGMFTGKAAVDLIKQEVKRKIDEYES